MKADVEHGRRVAAMFGRIAGWYDALNHILSAGLDLWWRRRMVAHLGVAGKEHPTILDLAAGTMDVSCLSADRHPTSFVVAADFALPMLQSGTRKIRGTRTGRIHPVLADGRTLPLADESVHAATIAFGIRNIRPRQAAYAEVLRVLKPGGRFCILEFGSGKTRIWKGLYNFYLNRLLPLIGRLSGDREAYRYLADTIMGFPSQSELATELYDAGFHRVFYLPMASGIVYLHVGQKAPKA
ncbi:ubiquinone/menaquinone biosynthesis methyltransferase [Desulfovibrio inopinatus]|uniref:ubiquinone/menaquinone biosynthesis methyltransferase n=1 Tax=Desulfovibrio inopinatus TaxID=102109 RepID=UPI0004076142|nr:ubiquinone/menaquinone biosynthesis methyltransferase [Desulfovibrio inopinatus]